MEGLNKKTRGDWFDLKQIADEPFELEEYFSFSKDRLQSVSGELRLAVEQGITEYKTKKLSGLYAFLESYQYDSRGFEALSHHGGAFTELLYVTLLQRLVATGIIEVRGPRNTEETGGSLKPGVKEIMKDVQERLAADPDLRKNESVKNILMQMSIYRNELSRMRELEPKILPERKASFLANFRNTFLEISGKIQEHYLVLTKEDKEKTATEIEETDPLKRYDLKALGKPLFHQAAEISNLRSTLLFAVSERYKTRDILSGITDRKDRTLLLIRMEQKAYTDILGEGRSPSVLGKAFAGEVIKVFARQISRISG